MRRGEAPEVRDLLRDRRLAEAAKAAEQATGRLLVGIEADGTGPVSPAHFEALRRHGSVLHRIGGRALVRLAFDRLCAVAPERASRRFDLIGRSWGQFLSREDRP